MAANLNFDLVETICNRPFLAEKLEIAQQAEDMVRDDRTFAMLLNHFYKVSREDSILLDWIAETSFEPALTLVKYMISLVFYGTEATDLRGFMLGVLEKYSTQVRLQMIMDDVHSGSQTVH